MIRHHISLAAQPADLLKTGAQLYHRFQRPWRTMLLLCAMMLGGMALALAIAGLLGNDLVAAMVASTYSFVGAFVVYQLGQRWLSRRHLADFATSALRNHPTPIILSEQGITFEPRSIDWSGVTDLRRDGAAMLIHFSGSDALLVRHADLPEGLTPDALIRQITEWRGKS